MDKIIFILQNFFSNMQILHYLEWVYHIYQPPPLGQDMTQG